MTEPARTALTRRRRLPRWVHAGAYLTLWAAAGAAAVLPAGAGLMILADAGAWFWPPVAFGALAGSAGGAATVRRAGVHRALEQWARRVALVIGVPLAAAALAAELFVWGDGVVRRMFVEGSVELVLLGAAGLAALVAVPVALSHAGELAVTCLTAEDDDPPKRRASSPAAG